MSIKMPTLDWVESYYKCAVYRMWDFTKSENALTDLKVGTVATAVNSPTKTADGYTLNGINQYLNLNVYYPTNDYTIIAVIKDIPASVPNELGSIVSLGNKLGFLEVTQQKRYISGESEPYYRGNTFLRCSIGSLDGQIILLESPSAETVYTISHSFENPGNSTISSSLGNPFTYYLDNKTKTNYTSKAYIGIYTYVQDSSVHIYADTILNPNVTDTVNSNLGKVGCGVYVGNYRYGGDVTYLFEDAGHHEWDSALEIKIHNDTEEIEIWGYTAYPHANFNSLNILNGETITWKTLCSGQNRMRPEPYHEIAPFTKYLFTNNKFPELHLTDLTRFVNVDIVDPETSSIYVGAVNWLNVPRYFTSFTVSGIIILDKSKIINRDDPIPIPSTINVDFNHSTLISDIQTNFTSICTDYLGSPVTASTYLWEFGDGTNSTDKNPSHTYTTSGNVTITLTVTNQDGDIFSKSSTVHVYSSSISIDGISVNPCEYVFAFTPFTLQPDNVVSDLPVTYNWNIYRHWNAGWPSENKPQTELWFSSTNETVTTSIPFVAGYMSYGVSVDGTTNKITASLTVSNGIHSTAISTTVVACPTNWIHTPVSNMPIEGERITNSTLTAKLKNLTIPNTRDGSYTRHPSITDPMCDPITDFTVTYHLHAFSGFGSQYIKTLGSTSNRSNDYALNFTINDSEFETYPNDPGHFRVIPYITHKYKSTPTEVSGEHLNVFHLVQNLPDPDFDISDTTIDIPTTVEFTDKTQTTQKITYKWYIRKTGTQTYIAFSTVKNPEYTIKERGFYDVKLVIANRFMSKEIIKLSCIQAKYPCQSLDFDSNYVPDNINISPLDVMFYPTGIDKSLLPVNYQYIWNFGDESTSMVENPTHTYEAPGEYTVSLTLRNVDCNITVTKQKYIVIDDYIPVANFDATPISGEPPLTVSFTNKSQYATSYIWDFGDGKSSTEENPTHTYTKIGTYTVILIAKNSAHYKVLKRKQYITVRGDAMYSLLGST